MEAALRHLGTINHGKPIDLLRHAIERPLSATGKALAALTRPTDILDGWEPEERAAAILRLIKEGIESPDVGPVPLSRRRRALYAAFRMKDPKIVVPWGASLHDRFVQLKVLTEVFGNATSTQPMEMAWKRGVSLLGRYLEERIQELRTPAAWQEYRPDDRAQQPDIGIVGWPTDFNESNSRDQGFRRPSAGAQPIFADLFVTTVFMKRRAVYRRITERLITAQEDDVAYYTARGFAGSRTGARRPNQLTYIPVQALWGCTAEFVEPERPGRPAVTRLRFPAPLRRGQQAYLASEIVDENITEERLWIDVDIDHHGIAQGQLAYGGFVPVSGLTIRVRFDESHLPEAVWWYAELNESERDIRPPDGDRHLLQISGRDVQYTFTEGPCQPRESYGVAFSWPTP
jgi:hypothetical protein